MYLCCKNHKSKRNTNGYFTKYLKNQFIRFILLYQYFLKMTRKNTLIHTLWRSGGLVTFAKTVTKLLPPHNITNLSLIQTKLITVYRLIVLNILQIIIFLSNAMFEIHIEVLIFIFSEKNSWKFELNYIISNDQPNSFTTRVK